MIAGTTETLGDILSVSAGPNGVHTAAIVTLSPSNRQALIVDGAVHESRGGSLAIEGELLGGFAHQVLSPTLAWFVFHWVDINGIGDVMFYGGYLGGSSPTSSFFRSGSAVRSLSNIAIYDFPIGIDERGFLFRSDGLQPAGSSGIERLPTSSGAPYLDVDKDGSADFGFGFIGGGPLNDNTVLAGNGDAYSTGGIYHRTFSSTKAVVEHVQILGNEVVCATEENSFGRGARLHGIGSNLAANNRFQLTAIGVASRALTIPLFSASVASLPGSSGGLCLAGPIGRGVYLIDNARVDGSIDFDVLLNAIPQPGGPVAVMPGQTWYAQLWFRDVGSGTATSRFSDAIELSFR